MGANEVQFSGYYPYYNAYQPIEYAAARTVEEKTDSVFAGAGSIAAFEAVTGTVKTIKAQKPKVTPVKKSFGEKLKGLFKKETYVAKGESIKETGKTLKNMGSEYVTAVKETKLPQGTIKEVGKNLYTKGTTSARMQAIEKCIPDAEKITKLASKASNESTARLISRDYDVAAKWLERAKTAKDAKTASKCMSFAEKHIAEANSVTAKTALGKTVGNIATKSPLLAKAGTVFKASGAGPVMAIEGVVELGTEVVPTFTKLGAKKGFKQLGKSAIKVGATGAGWAAGWYIGAAIGSVIPGAGTAVGAIVGGIISTVCALVGSSLAKKGAEKIVGESELKKAEKEEAQKAQIAQQQQAQQMAYQQQQLQQQQLANQQALYNQQQVANLNFTSNPFATTNFMDKDYMGLISGYVY